MTTTPKPRASGQAPEIAINGPIATLTLRRPEVANRLEIEDIHQLREQIAQSQIANAG